MQVEINPKEAYILLRLINTECPDNYIIKDLKQKLSNILGCALEKQNEKSFTREYVIALSGYGDYQDDDFDIESYENEIYGNVGDFSESPSLI